MQIQKLYSLFLGSAGISTDTRTLKKKALFFALKGENFDGNLFAEKALDQGAIGIVVDDAKLKKLGSNVVVVEDTLKEVEPPVSKTNVSPYLRVGNRVIPRNKRYGK